jgi:hypothetical protein
MAFRHRKGGAGWGPQFSLLVRPAGQRLDPAPNSVDGPRRDFLREISGSGTWRCGPGRCYGQAPWGVNAEHFEDYTVW